MQTERSTIPPTHPGEVVERFAACLNAGDLDGALSLYLPDAVFQAAPDRAPARGREAIREALGEFLAMRPRITGELKTVHEASDTALVINRWRISGTDAEGQDLEMGGTSADVMRRREDGSWAILVDDPWGGA